MKRSASDFESWASSTNSIILPKVVSSPTRSATTCRVPFSRMVPANTCEPFLLPTGTASPVMLASLIWPSPDRTVPSTGTFAPVLTSRVSPTSTSSTATSSNSPLSLSFKALSGAISVNSLIAERVFCNVRCSRYEPNKNRNVTIADSSKFLMIKAPATASVTSTSMLTTLTLSA